MPTSRTANDLIKDALLLLNVVNPSETPTDADAQQVLNTLQDLLAEWSDDGLLVPVVTTETLTLASGTASYTVGQNGTPSLTTVRPELVNGAFIREGSYDYQMQIIGEREYRLTLDKSTATSRPDKLYVLYSAPNATFYPLPVPDTTYSLVFVSTKPFSEPAILTEDLLNTTLLPRNYYSALKWNLACEMGPYFEKQPNQWMLRRAAVTKNQLVGLNIARRLEAVRLELAGGKGGGTILGY